MMRDHCKVTILCTLMLGISMLAGCGKGLISKEEFNNTSGQEITIDLSKTMVRDDLPMPKPTPTPTVKPKPAVPAPYKAGEVLMKTKWGQGYPYNMFLPEMAGQKVVAGCTNTAIAQILYFHGYPKFPKGKARSTWNGKELIAYFNKPYNWSEIPVEITTATPEYKREEIGSLFRDLGIINKTAFSWYKSFSAFRGSNMVENLGLDPDIKTISKAAGVTDANFNTIIKKEIDNKRPMYLGIGRKSEYTGFNYTTLAHAVVIDGYKEENGVLKFHLNMGWDGKNDGFYNLDEIIKIRRFLPGGAVSYSIGDHYVVRYNIKACVGNRCFGNDLEDGDKRAGKIIEGKLAKVMDKDSFKNVLLKGRTVFTKESTEHIAYFIRVYDRNDKLISEGEINGNDSLSFGEVKAGKYKVVVSQCNDGISCFVNIGDYKLSFETEELTEEEKRKESAARPVQFTRTQGHKVIKRKFNEIGMRLDAFNEDADEIVYSVESDDVTDRIKATVVGNIVKIKRDGEIDKGTRKITITATVKKDNKVTKSHSFQMLLVDKQIGFGKKYSVTGRFAAQNGRYLKRVVLDGSCTISGSRGYANQSFFINVKPVNGSTMFSPMFRGFRHVYKRGIYDIEASLSSGYSFYSLTKGHENFIIRVRCPNFDNDFDKLKKLLLPNLKTVAVKPKVTPTPIVAVKKKVEKKVEKKVAKKKVVKKKIVKKIIVKKKIVKKIIVKKKIVKKIIVKKKIVKKKVIKKKTIKRKIVKKKRVGKIIYRRKRKKVKPMRESMTAKADIRKKFDRKYESMTGTATR